MMTDEITGIIKRYEEKQIASKEQLETKDEYKKRISALMKEQQEKFTIYLMNIIQYGMLRNDKVKYDIEQQSFIFKKNKFVDIQTRVGDINAILDGFTFIIEKENLGTYIGENVFGVKREIQKQKYTRYSIIPINYKSLNEFSKGDDFIIQYKCNKDNAKDIINDVILVIDFTPTIYSTYKDSNFYSFTTTNRSTRQPTIESPYEIESYGHYLFVKILAFYFVNQQTGEILKTINIKQ